MGKVDEPVRTGTTGGLDHLELFRRMLRIRRYQLRIETEYHEDQMKTPVHLCLGQEAVAVGVTAVLTREDYVVSNHRSHGHYLAKGGDLEALTAELFNRETGCSKGRGGSMHVVDPKVSHLGSSSIVGGGIPIGTGHALASRMKGDGRITAVFFGDGAADEGVLYESVNFAMLRRLPVIYVLENNQYSVCSPIARRQAGPSLFHQAPSDKLLTAQVDGNKLLDVLAAAEKAADRARRGEGPSFIECVTYRWRGHAGAGSDVHLGYRPVEEIQCAIDHCPVAELAQRLEAEGRLTPSIQAAMEQEIDREIDQAFLLAKAAPLPRPEDLGLYLYKE
jgi:pyruvate dehydrogenase E1 component alpha subunit